MRFAQFTKRTDAPTLIRCLMATLEYFGGAPRAVLTDRMKSVLVRVEGGAAQWHADFGDFVASLGITPRVCLPTRPRPKARSSAPSGC